MLTKEQREAACVFFGFAVLAYRGEPEQPSWYVWTTVRYSHERHPFARVCWWAIRMADDDHDSPEEWLSYVEHVYDNHKRSGQLS